MGIVLNVSTKNRKAAAAIAAELARDAVLDGRSVTLGPPDNARGAVIAAPGPTQAQPAPPKSPQPATLMGEYIRESDLVRTLQISRTTIWRMVQAGAFPQPQRQSARRKVWRVEEVREWMNNTADARNPSRSDRGTRAP